jgi:hypothetical protein
MANTFELIASSTVGSGGAASIDFTSIPATFTDLCLKVSARNTSSGNSFKLSFNTSSANFTNRRIYANGSTVDSYSGSDVFIYANTSSQTASTFNNAEIYIPNYTGSTNKSMSIDTVVENNATANEMSLIAGLWSQTAAITAIGFTPYVGSFAQYTTAYLYGVSNA